jgi:hypothetical protein
MATVLLFDPSKRRSGDASGVKKESVYLPPVQLYPIGCGQRPPLVGQDTLAKIERIKESLERINLLMRKISKSPD